MKVATWNVNSIRTRLEQVINWLQENPVDILCLQETKVQDGDFPRSPFEKLGFHLYISGQKSYNGVAILGQKPLEDVTTGFYPILGISDFDDQKRVITAVLDGIRIVNLYVPNGSSVGSDKYDYKLRWLKALRDYLEALLEKQPSGICVCGDFNVAMEDKDIHNPKGREKMVMATDLERQALRAVLELGLGDAFRKFTEEGGYFSWWDYRSGAFGRNYGWRIDHQYLTPNLYDRAIGCAIDIAPRKLPQPSDHAPVIVELR